MKTLKLGYFGATNYWWVVLLVGLLLVVSGLAYWFWPFTGYVVASSLFGWLLIALGVVQVCVCAGPSRSTGWGWWLAGGVIDMFIGFTLVRNVLLSAVMLPVVFAAVFLYWGVEALVSAFSRRSSRYWWMGIINGILMLVIAYFFFESAFLNDVMMVSFVTAIGFIYWGFALALTAFELKPNLDNLQA
jgi:uncharacterized membrane protein HdeD (DUF308 family)